MLKNGFIDLHTHTNNSDGTFTPKQLTTMAHDNCVKILAITDHDSISGLDEFRSSIPSNMIGVKGIEFSSYVIDNDELFKIHMLGYCFDEHDTLFQGLVREMKEKRVFYHSKLLNEIKEKIHNAPVEEIEKLNINKYCWFDREIIDYLEKSKYPHEIISDIKLYCKMNRFGYGSDYDLNVMKVIDTIHLAGGYAVFAHPMAYKFSDDREKVKSVINKLINMGIDGIEVHQSDCSSKDTIWLKEIVDNHNLLYSAGSDFHRIIDSDGRQVGLGIDNNLCVVETTLTNEIVKTKKYFMKSK